MCVCVCVCVCLAGGGISFLFPVCATCCSFVRPERTQGNYKAAAKYFNYLVTKVPSDPGALTRLGQIFAKDDDETQAFHYHFEAYRYFPVNLEVISWLGVWYVKSELYEKAIEFFERASEIQPTEVKWKLMVASCHRRMLNYARALELYEEINTSHPDNVECLRYLVALCKDLGRRHDQYESKLLRLERAAQNTAAGALTRVGGGGGYDDQGAGGGGQHMYGGGGGYGGDEPIGAMDSGGQGGYGGGGAAGGPDMGYGSSADRFTAPNVAGNMESAGGRAVRDEETFADAGKHQ
jgi:Tfp pilus assembly protein PilF